MSPLLGQMAGRIERLRLQQAEAGTAEAKRIGKDIDSLTKQLTELRAFDDELKHHADMRITLISMTGSRSTTENSAPCLAM